MKFILKFFRPSARKSFHFSDLGAQMTQIVFMSSSILKLSIFMQGQKLVLCGKFWSL